MRKNAFITILFCLFCLLENAWSNWSPPVSLESKLQELVDSSETQARLGLAVWSLKEKKLIHSIRSREAFAPASTLKLVVTAAAIDTMPADHFHETWIRLFGEQTGRTFYGDLTLVGRGDPNISARYFPTAFQELHRWVDTLLSLGIDTIQGKILTDESFYVSPRKPSTWEKRFYDRWYGAEVSALSYNDNCVQLVVSPPEHPDSLPKIEFRPDVGIYQVKQDLEIVKKGRGARRTRINYKLDPNKNVVELDGQIGLRGSNWYATLPVRNPQEFFKAAFVQAMKDRGLVWIPHEYPGTMAGWGELRFKTTPLLSQLDEINQRSQNLHAEMLCRNLGEHVFGEASLQNGLLAEKVFLNKIGLDSSQFTLLDASGLSYGNRVLPENMSRLVAKMARHPRSWMYVKSMGEPGVTGASRKRLANLEVSHKVRVKTGFINFVQGLVGTLETSYGDTLAVALYLNEYKGSDHIARDLMDSMWTKISLFHNMEYASLKQARNLWNEGSEIKGLQKRLDFFSKKLLDTPYLLGPTGEGSLARIERKPLLEMGAFDCVTFIEHVMALSYSKNQNAILKTLSNIRYEDGEINFSKRKHYFVEDWLSKSKSWVQIFTSPVDSIDIREMDKRGFFAAKKLPYGGENPKTQLNFIPFSKAIDLKKNVPLAPGVYGIGFLTNYQKIWVSHTGLIVVSETGPIKLRHASSKSKKVVEVELSKYLESRTGKLPGILLFEFIPK